MYYQNTKITRGLLLMAALLIIVISTLFSNRLAHQIAQDEQKQMQIWARATELFIQADSLTDIDFVSSIMEDNTTIPVYMTDEAGQILLTRNVQRVGKLPTQHAPIEVTIDGVTKQYIYYDDSRLLKMLQWYPYIQIGVIAIFLFLVVATIKSSQRSEQNYLWAALSKETAHQLGTPITSLNGWIELLSDLYPADELIPQMRDDVVRLQTIADRFSKVGSDPQLLPTDIVQVIEQQVAYTQRRVSNKVHIQTELPAAPVVVQLSPTLFQWVIENLCKNAIDAMGGAGEMLIRVSQSDTTATIDVVDHGHGIAYANQKTIFQPGYTTKQRGWGLGLSLSRRIVEDFHKGKIFVAKSTLQTASNSQHGTTIRIQIPLWSE